jgi:hypothetical protein
MGLCIMNCNCIKWFLNYRILLQWQNKENDKLVVATNPQAHSAPQVTLDDPTILGIFLHAHSYAKAVNI